MTAEPATPDPPVRKLVFRGTGSRPIKEVATRRRRYQVQEPEPSDEGDPCPFRRPGCACGVPF